MYNPFDATADYSTEISELATTLTDATTEQGAGKAGVLLLAFDETTDILTAASADAVLGASTEKWYASDGITLSSVVTADDTVSQYAAQVGLVSSIYGESDSAKFAEIKSRLVDALGTDPTTYAIVECDAVWLAALSFRDAGLVLDAAALKSTIPVTAAATTGATGPLTLNAAGDRQDGNIDF
jgi:hypothetical protein